MSVTEFLAQVPLFSHLSGTELAKLGAVTRQRKYPKNSVIVFEDDAGDALYVVQTGRVKVVLIGEDGREVILSVLDAGDFFGEMALIDDRPRSAHVIAMEDSDLLILRREEFEQRLKESPSMALGLLKELSGRLRLADEKIGGLALKDVGGRVAQVLLRLADDGDGKHITKRVTHHTIAQMVGSSRETVSRSIGSLVEQGIITVDRGAVEIRDRAALEAAAGR